MGRSGLINFITKLPRHGEPVLIGFKNTYLVQDFTTSQQGTHSKGILIIQIKEPLIKWTNIIISIFLTNVSQSSEIKQEILEVVKHIIEEGKVYNWVDHLTNIV